mmetsp:Transcript_29388/g.80323  ORF Transcript_29388/g.80323 Transcript_29388/m.80323 type:complete len:330 (-) Transcript_29388:594-1583(-)
MPLSASPQPPPRPRSWRLMRQRLHALRHSRRQQPRLPAATGFQASSLGQQQMPTVAQLQSRRRSMRRQVAPRMAQQRRRKLRLHRTASPRALRSALANVSAAAWARLSPAARLLQSQRGRRRWRSARCRSRRWCSSRLRRRVPTPAEPALQWLHRTQVRWPSCQLHSARRLAVSRAERKRIWCSSSRRKSVSAAMSSRPAPPTSVPLAWRSTRTCSTCSKLRSSSCPGSLLATRQKRRRRRTTAEAMACQGSLALAASPVASVVGGPSTARCRAARLMTLCLTAGGARWRHPPVSPGFRTGRRRSECRVASHSLGCRRLPSPRMGRTAI